MPGGPDRGDSGGRIVAEGAAATLGGRDTGASIVSFTLPLAASAADLPPAVAAAVTGGLGVKRSKHELMKPAARAWRPGRLGGWHEPSIFPTFRFPRPTLEDVYLQLTRESR